MLIFARLYNTTKANIAEETINMNTTESKDLIVSFKVSTISLVLVILAP